MAHIARLALRQRWGSWSQGAFTRESKKHGVVPGRSSKSHSWFELLVLTKRDFSN